MTLLTKHPGIAAPGLVSNFALKMNLRNLPCYTRQLGIKFMVQSRQLSFEHADSHYAAAIFKYLREFSILHREHTSLDDKHVIKCGEPNHPVAAIDRGKRVLVAADKSFLVSDHDFTKARIVPSVSLPFSCTKFGYAHCCSNCTTK